jgi:hypothetical protein
MLGHAASDVGVVVLDGEQFHPCLVRCYISFLWLGTALRISG